MNTAQLEATLTNLYKDAKKDRLKMAKRLAMLSFKPLQPKDFKDVYLSISKKEGAYLKELIQRNKLKNIVEFGTSFGISTLFLAQGVHTTAGRIITTELLASKAQKAKANFKAAGVHESIEVRIGDAMDTLKNHKEPIDLLVLDGWKNLYLPLFQMLEPNFHNNSYIYVDNAEMAETKVFLQTIGMQQKYHMQSLFDGKVVLITRTKEQNS